MSDEVQAAYERAVEQLLSDETVLGALPEEQIQPLLDGAIARLERAAAEAEGADAFAAAFDAIRTDLRAEVMAAADREAEPLHEEVSVDSPSMLLEAAWLPSEGQAAEAEREQVEARGPEESSAIRPVERADLPPDELGTAQDGVPFGVMAADAATSVDEVAPGSAQNFEPMPEGDGPGAVSNEGDVPLTGDGSGDERGLDSATYDATVTTPQNEGLVEEAREAFNRFGARLRGLLGREQNR